MVVSLLLTLTILSLLVFPIYILSRLTRHSTADTDTEVTVTIIILLVFTLLFSGALWLFTRAKRHEILSAAAAYGLTQGVRDKNVLTKQYSYCAVLVVFIGNISTIAKPDGK